MEHRGCRNDTRLMNYIMMLLVICSLSVSIVTHQQLEALHRRATQFNYLVEESLRTVRDNKKELLGIMADIRVNRAILIDQYKQLKFKDKGDL